jgi:hypothetical protein
MNNLRLGFLTVNGVFSLLLDADVTTSKSLIALFGASDAIML